MKKQSVIDNIDMLRERQFFQLDGIVLDRICNYIEANIDEFMECYEEKK